MIEPIDPSHVVSGFDCGKPALNDWLLRRALSNHREGFTSVFVAHDQRRVIGYYGLSPTGILPKVFPRALRTGQPPNPLPCILLGRLAVDVNLKGRGLGGTLLMHALRGTLSASAFIGGRALVVQAIDDDALAFWKSRGFAPTEDNPHILFMSLAVVKATVARFDETTATSR